MNNLMKFQPALAAGALVLANFAMVGTASAHCDALDGPVITETRSALEKKDVTPLLKWVPEKGERAIKDAFAQTLAERTGGKAAQEAADRKLFEKLVRVHRESEGAPFTGIKSAGQIPPVVAEADAALEKKNVDHLAKHIAAQVEKSIRDKFEKAAHSKEYANQSVEKGREFVGNYVQYVHFVEEVNNMTEKSTGHHETMQKPSGHKH
ncbi:MAG: DUF6448 family protein [Sterolibacterium sp.]